MACEALLVLGRAERVTSLERAQGAFAEAAALAEANHLLVWRLRSLHELGTIDMLERGQMAGCSRLVASLATSVRSPPRR